MSKIELKEKIAAIDLNARDLWDEMDDTNRKTLKQEFFILNRYISNVQGRNKDIKEHFVLAVNELYNKHYFLLQNHPKLLWLLLCMCSYNAETVFYHEWIGFKKTQSKEDSKKIKFLEEIYPNMKEDEIELLAKINSISNLKELAKKHGYDDKRIKAMF